MLEQPLFEVGIAETAGVVVAEHPLNLRCRQHLTDHVEHGVIVEGVADLLKLFQEPLEHPALDGVRGDEVKDQTVLALAVAVDTPHALLEAVGVPGDVVVEENVADLEVDPFSGRLGRHEDLDRSFPELLLRVKPRPRLVARSRLHAAVDVPNAEAPGLQTLHQVVERVLELGENEQPLLRMVKESLLLKQLLELRKFSFRAGILNRPGLAGQRLELLNLLLDLLGVACERDGLERFFESLPLALLHFLQFVRVGKVRRGQLCEVLGSLQSLLQTLGPVLQRVPHGVGARGQPALIEGHQEADGAGARVVALRCGLRTLLFHEACDVAVQLELRPVDLEFHGTRDALCEDGARGPGAVGLPLWEIDHRLLGAAQVEGRPPAVHGLADGADVGIGVRVEELEEEAEILRIALVRRGRQQQHVIGCVPQELAQLVAQTLVGFVCGRHAVRFVHDDKVPVDLAQTGEDLVPLGEVERGDDPLLL